MIDLAQTKVLELNKNWQVLGTISLEDALTSVANTSPRDLPKAKIIHPEELRPMTWDDWSRIETEEWDLFFEENPEYRKKPDENGKKEDDYKIIRSSRLTVRVPEIIMWTKFDKNRQPKNVFSRRTLYKRDGYKCQYCGCRPGSESLSIDHVIPKSQGGPTTWWNCVLACVSCNSRKANRTPEQAGMKLLSIPEKPKQALLRCEYVKVNSWQAFLGEMYWLTELENQNPD